MRGARFRHRPLARYLKLRVGHAPVMAATFSLPPRVSGPNMHHGTCVTHVPWCMLGSLTSGFLWVCWRGKRSRHSRRMHNPQFYVSGKRPMFEPDFVLRYWGLLTPIHVTKLDHYWFGYWLCESLLPMLIYCQLHVLEQASVRLEQSKLSFRKMHLKIISTKYRPWWLCLNVSNKSGLLVNWISYRLHHD